MEEKRNEPVLTNLVLVRQSQQGGDDMSWLKRRTMTFTLAATLTTMAVSALNAQAQPSDCNARSAEPSVTVDLPASPFAVVSSSDGCWVFVSLMAPKPGVQVLKRGGGSVQLASFVPFKGQVSGIVVTHDGKLVIATSTSDPEGVVFLDAQRLTSGAANPILGSFEAGPENIYANVTADDKLLFVSEEAGRAISVIDLEQARANGYKSSSIIGKIPVGNAPIGLRFSPDGKWLYTTSQGATPDWKWPKACKPEGQNPATAQIVNPEGAVVVIDVARAKTDPAQAVVARVPAGCSPVRMAISPSGDRIYVTARNSNAVVAFDTAKLLTDAEHSRIGEAPVGSAPVPIAVVDDGKKVVAGNSNRFAGTNDPQSLIVLDAAKIKDGADASRGSIPAGAFPRDLSVSADGRTLFLANFGSKSLQVMDVARLP
jgi:DNA-binding beta-propeller fold protein YncE